MLALFFLCAALAALPSHAVVVKIFLDPTCTTPPPTSMGYDNQADEGNGLPPFFPIYADMCHAFVGGATTASAQEANRQYNGMALEKCTSTEIIVNLFSFSGRPQILWGVPRDDCSTEVEQRIALTPGVCTPVTAWSRSAAAPQMYWQVSDSSCDPPAPVFTLSLARTNDIPGFQPCTSFRDPNGPAGSSSENFCLSLPFLLL